jgi:F1F0 ATPase subunit 2
MIDLILSILFAFVLGVTLGSFYFGSLWLTVRQLPTTAYPARLFLSSWLCRIVITLLGFYLVMDGQWQRALICLGGFVTARIVMMQFWQPKHKLNFEVSRRED